MALQDTDLILVGRGSTSHKITYGDFKTATTAVEMSPTAPPNPDAGSVWWNSDDGRLYIYYTDANSSQWVDASPDSPAPPGLWQRAGTTLSPSTVGDAISTTGNVSAADATFSGNVQAASLNGGQLAGFRNQIINGNFLVFQRGDINLSGETELDIGTNSAFRKYTIDRWVTFSQLTKRVDGPFGYAVELSGTPGASTNHQLSQLVEVPLGTNGCFLSGSTWTFSAYVSTAEGDLNFEAYWVDDKDATNAVAVNAGTATQDTGETVSGLKRVSVTFTIGAAPAATTNALLVAFTSTRSLNAVFAGFQLEPGPVATPFEQRPIGTELALCQRYYQETNADQVGYNGDGNNISYYMQIDYKQTMRIAPTTAFTPTTTANVTNTPILNVDKMACLKGATVASTGSYTNFGVLTLEAEL